MVRPKQEQPGHVLRILDALVRRCSEGDDNALEQLVVIQRAVGERANAGGRALVACGYSYAEVAAVLGITRQTAYERFRDRSLDVCPDGS